MCILNQTLLLEHVENGQGGGTCQMVASESGTQLSIDGLELGRYEHTAHWEAVGYSLCHGDDVGAYVEPLVGEELSAAAVTALYLVAYQHRVVLLAKALQTLRKLLRGHLNAANTLDALQYHGADIALLQFSLPRRKVVQRQIGDVSVGVYRGYDFRVVGHFHSQ